jgi:hypothetical protein
VQPVTRNQQLVTRNRSRRSAVESRLSSLIFGARSEIIRWTWIDARYLPAYGKSKHSQDTDRASTCAEAITQKGTFCRGSAFAEGQDSTIDRPVPGTRSSLAKCIASSCGRPPTTLFPPELRAFLSRVKTPSTPGSPRTPGAEEVRTKDMNSTKIGAGGDLVRTRSTWKSWLIVVLLGLLALASPYLNPQSAKPKVTAPPAQSD